MSRGKLYKNYSLPRRPRRLAPRRQGRRPCDEVRVLRGQGVNQFFSL